MKLTIVKPSYEILKAPTQDDLKFIERCGRTCYQSEDRITATSASKFVRALRESKHECVIEHVSATVKFVCSRSCSHQLVRHRLASYCLAGDTSVRAFGSSNKGWTLEQLYRWSSDPKRKGRLRLIRLRSMDASGLLVPGKIKSIVASGRQEVFKITTDFGRTIRATAKHRFATPDGWKTVAELSAGSKVFCNGKEAIVNEEWLRREYIEKNRSRKDIAQQLGVCEGTLYKTAIVPFGLQKSHKDYPNRQPGHGQPGMFSKEQREEMRATKLGVKNPQWKGEKVGRSGGYMRCCHKYDLDGVTCQCCNNPAVERHHRDKNSRNNEPGNIMLLCVSCHKQWHRGQAVKSVFTDTVVSIESDGVTDTYDIEMDGPNHNFSAEGFIVHNSQESQRYCNGAKKGFTFICPESIGIIPGTYQHPYPEHFTGKQLYWLKCRFQECGEYLDAIEAGMKPEEARECLPNATKTEIVMTCNLRTWRHVFKERCAPAAQAPIRKLMRGVLREFNAATPELFDDLMEML